MEFADRPGHDGIVIDRVETFVLRLDHDGRPVADPPRYRAAADRGTLYSGSIETVLVRIESRDGAVGWGEALSPVGPRITSAIVDDLLAGMILGRDATAIRPLHDELQHAMRERGHLGGYHADAVAAVDIALWDLVGTTWGRSVSDLLGGAYRTVVPTYVSSIAGAVDTERAASIQALRESGTTHFKLHLGQGVDADLRSFASARAAAPDARFAVDVHGVYSEPQAIRLGRGLEAADAWFLESAVPPDDVEGFRAIAAALDLTVAAGEALRNRFEAAIWLNRRALDLYQPDIARTGITEGTAIAALADAAYRPVAPHHSLALGPALAAGLHVAATTRDMPAFEYQIGAVRAANALLEHPLEVHPDHMVLPSGPGLGITVAEASVREFAVER